MNKELFKKMKSEPIDFDILYYNLIGHLGLEKTREFLWECYNMKEELKQIEEKRKEKTETLIKKVDQNILKYRSEIERNKD